MHSDFSILNIMYFYRSMYKLSVIDTCISQLQADCLNNNNNTVDTAHNKKVTDEPSIKDGEFSTLVTE